MNSLDLRKLEPVEKGWQGFFSKHTEWTLAHPAHDLCIPLATIGTVSPDRWDDVFEAGFGKEKVEQRKSLIEAGEWPIMGVIRSNGGTTTVPAVTTPLGARQMASCISPGNVRFFQYLCRCAQASPELFHVTLAFWLSRASQKDNLVRFIGDASNPRFARLRACLGPEYGIVNDSWLYAQVLQAIEHAKREGRGWSDLLIKGFQRTAWGETSYLQLVNPNIKRIGHGPDPEHVMGVQISNSETGLRSVRFSTLAYRLICTNGMVAPVWTGVERIIHRGDATHEKVLHALDKMFEMTESVITRMQEMAEMKVKDLSKAYEGISEQLGFTEAERKGSELLLETSPQDTTLFDIMQSFSAYGNTLGGGAAMYEMQEKAGRLMEKVAVR